MPLSHTFGHLDTGEQVRLWRYSTHTSVCVCVCVHVITWCGTLWCWALCTALTLHHRACMSGFVIRSYQGTLTAIEASAFFCPWNFFLQGRMRPHWSAVVVPHQYSNYVPQDSNTRGLYIAQWKSTMYFECSKYLANLKNCKATKSETSLAFTFIPL